MARSKVSLLIALAVFVVALAAGLLTQTTASASSAASLRAIRINAQFVRTHCAKITRQLDAIAGGNSTLTGLTKPLITLNQRMLKYDRLVAARKANSVLRRQAVKLNTRVDALDARVLTLDDQSTVRFTDSSRSRISSLRARVQVWLGRFGQPAPTPPPAPTPTPTPTPDPTPTVTPTPTPDPTPTVSPDPTPTVSPDPTPSPSPSPSSPGNAVVITDLGATANDAGDDTAAVRAALAQAQSQGRPVYVPAGTFIVSSITIPDGMQISGAGDDASTLQGIVTAGSNDLLSDIRIGVIDHAFHIVNGGHDTTLERVYLQGGGVGDSYPDPAIIRFGSGESASNITFRDCTIGTNQRGGNGVSIVDSGYAGGSFSNILFQGCTFLSSPRMSFECIQRTAAGHSLTTGYSHIDIIDCTFEPSGSETISYDGTSLCGNSQVTGNLLKGAGTNPSDPWGSAIEFNGPTHMTFAGNTVYRCRQAMVNDQGSAGTADNNAFHDNAFDNTVNLIGQEAVAGAPVFLFGTATGDTVTNNTVTVNSGGPVFYFSGSCSNTVSGNRITDKRPAASAAAAAFLASSSSGNVFSSNHITTPFHWGTFCINTGSDHTSILSNTFVISGAMDVLTDGALTVTKSGNIYQ